jgi:hypothetical protein
MIIYVVKVPQINSYGNLLEDDLPVSYHATAEGAAAEAQKQASEIIKIWGESMLTDRENENTAEIIQNHCYVEEVELAN